MCVQHTIKMQGTFRATFSYEVHASKLAITWMYVLSRISEDKINHRAHFKKHIYTLNII